MWSCSGECANLLSSTDDGGDDDGSDDSDGDKDGGDSGSESGTDEAEEEDEGVSGSRRLNSIGASVIAIIGAVALL